MSSPILTTKLYIPPPRPGLVPRRRLIARVKAGIEDGRKITLISAPAGFGKTTLMSACAAECGWPVAWLSLDAGDNDLATFWTYIIAACRTRDPALGTQALAELEDPHPPPWQIVVTHLLNDLATLSNRHLLILDDYQVIEDRDIHASLTYFITHLPQTLHLLLTTRADPPLALSQLRARGQLTELRVRDLRFTHDEVTSFLNDTMALSLAPADIEAIGARTEGWAAGLQLAALSMRHCEDTHTFVDAFAGTHHYILEYLTDQVIVGQPEPVRRFLMETSILARLCGPLCDAVMGTQSGDGTLTDLLHDNLFVVPLDEEHHWFRYHHLFADLLGNLLRKSTPVTQIHKLHERAAAWFEQQGMIDEAIRHALQAQTYERAARLIEQAIQTTLSRGRVTTLLQWAQALPEPVAVRHPRLRMYQAWSLFLNADCESAKALLEDAWAQLTTPNENTDQDSRPFQTQSAPSAETAALRGELLAMLSTLSMVENAISQAMQQAREALDSLPETDFTSRARATRALGLAYGAQGDTRRAIRTCEEAKSLALAAGNTFLAAEVISQLAGGYLSQGRLHVAARACQDIVELVTPPSRFPPAGMGYIGLAAIAFERNQLEGLSEMLEEGCALCRQGGIGYSLRPALYTQALLSQARGDHAEAITLMHKASQFNPNVALVEGTVLAVSHQTRLNLLLGDVEAAARWASGKDIAPNVSFETLPPPFHEIWQVARARVALARRAYNETLAIAAAVIAQATPDGRMARVIEGTLLSALALDALGRRPEALTALVHCLTLAAPEGYCRLFIEAGSPVIPLLQATAARGAFPNYIPSLLAALGETTTPGRAATAEAAARPLDPLTPREREILRLITQGCSNQQIADRLVVTLNTVKKHTSNLYSKLGVSRRTQAAARARELGLA